MEFMEKMISCVRPWFASFCIGGETIGLIIIFQKFSNQPHSISHCIAIFPIFPIQLCTHYKMAFLSPIFYPCLIKPYAFLITNKRIRFDHARTHHNDFFTFRNSAPQILVVKHRWGHLTGDSDLRETAFTLESGCLWIKARCWGSQSFTVWFDGRLKHA